MVLYPINLIVDGRLCTIIGGGRVAFRKAQALLECGARLKVVAPDLASDFAQIAGKIGYIGRAYQTGDLQGSFLVIAATDDDETNRAVEEEAGRLGLPLNVVDKPEQCNFFVPSSVRRGDFMVTVSTGGQLPALSKRLRKQLEAEFPEEWAQALELLGEARRKVIKSINDEDRKQRCLSQLAALDLVNILKTDGPPAAREEIEKCISQF